MIKRQYFEWPGPRKATYFNNFIDSTSSDQELKELLKQYKASLGKSKQRHVFNVKWHDPKLYTIFVLRWS